MADTRKTETCARCGRKVEMTMSMSVPGQPPTPPICMKCLRELPKFIKSGKAK